MAKNSNKKEDEPKKVVAKCENPNEVVANCDHPDEVIANCESPQENSLSQYDIEKLIVTVRGEQVLIDQDIARIYQYTKGTVLFVYETDWRELRVHKRDGSFCVQTTSYFDSWRLRKRKPKKTKKAKNKYGNSDIES